MGEWTCPGKRDIGARQQQPAWIFPRQNLSSHCLGKGNSLDKPLYNHTVSGGAWSHFHTKWKFPTVLSYHSQAVQGEEGNALLETSL